MSLAYIDTPAPVYAAGDTPGDALVLEIAEAPDWTTGASATWELEGGTEPAAAIASVTYDSGPDPATVTLGIDASAVAAAGVLVVRIYLEGEGTEREALAPYRIPVESLEGPWLSLAELREEWADAPENNRVLFAISRAAIRAILRWAPNNPNDPATPDADSYRRAHVMHSRATWQAATGTTSDTLGDGEFAVTIYPLDWHVKNVLRGKTAPDSEAGAAADWGGF